MNLLEQLIKDFTAYTFVAGEHFSWAPRKRTIQYDSMSNPDSNWSLLHELGHATLGHRGYKRDIELIQLEVEAWDKASKIGHSYGITINWRHIEQCIDSYRDWLHARSTCPRCNMVSFQFHPLTYKCINCHTSWHVSKSRLCRIHRRVIIQKQPLR